MEEPMTGLGPVICYGVTVQNSGHLSHGEAGPRFFRIAKGKMSSYQDSGLTWIEEDNGS